MATDILETFYGKMLPTFPPQAEKILYSLQPERFDKLAFRYTFSVEAMIAISHIIETAVIDTPKVAALHVSFQYLSRLVPQHAIYKELGLTAKGLWLYCAPDADSTEIHAVLASPRTTLIDTSNSPMLDYWFVAAYGEGISKLLLAHEVHALAGEDRFYEGFYTFSPFATYEFLQILHQAYPDLVPEPETPQKLGLIF
ncbi:MAG TPA: hypothetical protein PK530_20665 [Anaerolineales bacterium]|nr:hypothetical protein [Anaerolineales bacterium]